jgi:hypothetical protein
MAAGLSGGPFDLVNYFDQLQHLVSAGQSFPDRTRLTKR